MDTDEKLDIIEAAIDNLESILSTLESVRECKRIYDMLDRSRVQLDELSSTFDIDGED
jgi:hypothetical protein